MGIFHRATIEPTKKALIASWAPTRPWGPAVGEPLVLIGSYRFDDPEGAVGMEAFLLSAGGRLLHVPLTYRDAPLAGAEEALIGPMAHSVLGRRWVYDGLQDPAFTIMLAAVTMTGQGEALGMAVYDGRWHIAPTAVRIRGGGWSLERVAVDHLELVADDAERSLLRNERFEVTAFRRPTAGPTGPLRLTATWPGQEDPVVLATVVER